MRNMDVLIDFYKRNNPKEEKSEEEKNKLMGNLERRLNHFINYPSGYKYYYDYDAREIAALSLDYFIYGEEPVAKILKDLADNIERKIRSEQVSAWEMFKLNIGVTDRIYGSKSFLQYYSEHSFLPTEFNEV